MEFEEIFTYENLYKSYRKCLKGVRWKGTVQRFQIYSLSGLNQLLKEIKEESFQSGNFFKFDIMERGKLRHIQSVGIRERIVQKSLCDYCLVPDLSKNFIYDNMACLKGKGVHKSYERMKDQLRKYYKKYKTNEGYILQFDFHHYFDTIPHDKLLYKIREHVPDDRVFKLISRLVNDFEGDKGLGLGSQISQISALFYPNELDHKFIKTEGITGYGRYMDDGYVISNNKEVLHYLAGLLKEITDDLGIELNDNKTQISKLGRGFIYLKARFFLTKTGKVVMKFNRKNINRNRRKLKKLFNKGKSLQIIDDFVKIIVGNMSHFDSYHTTQNFLKLYEKEKEKMLQHVHPYIDEKGTAHEDLVKTYSDEGLKIMQVETGLIFEDVVDCYPCKFTYKEVKEPEEEVAEA